MCTTFVYKNKYFGRNMDIDIPFGEKIIFTPNGYWDMYKCVNSSNKYKILGIGSLVNDTPLYAEAINEYGLYMAGLNFPYNAEYGNEKDDLLNLAPYELIPYFLGNYKNIDELQEDIKNLNIVNIEFKQDLPLASLHFFLSDGNKNLVIEQVKEGLKIYEDKVGVLTNNPIYPYHIYNLQNYANLNVRNPHTYIFEENEYLPYGEGIGLFGLPGDFSPTSRYIRSAILKNYMEKHESINFVSDVFHLLDNTAMIRGSVITKNNRLDITRYSVCYSKLERKIWIKTYDNFNVYSTSFSDFDRELESIDFYSFSI